MLVRDVVRGLVLSLSLEDSTGLVGLVGLEEVGICGFKPEFCGGAYGSLAVLLLL